MRSEYLVAGASPESVANPVSGPKDRGVLHEPSGSFRRSRSKRVSCAPGRSPLSDHWISASWLPTDEALINGAGGADADGLPASANGPIEAKGIGLNPGVEAIRVARLRDRSRLAASSKSAGSFA